MSRQHQAKSLGNLVIQKCPSSISGDFEKNKDLVNKILFYESSSTPALIDILGGPYDAKRLRNEIAGYITKEYNKAQEHMQNPSYDPHGAHLPPKKRKKIGRYFRKQR